jgi:hypothetical protein
MAGGHDFTEFSAVSCKAVAKVKDDTEGVVISSQSICYWPLLIEI